MTYVRSSKKFINPYTFVPPPKNRDVKRTELEKVSSASLHTGILRCRLFVRTPLGIPDAEKERELNGHKEYSFFSYGEEKPRVPAIPGSSLRGPVRSVFEAATDSCFSTLRDDTGLSKRVNNRGAYKSGILKWVGGEWKLYQAERYLLAADPNPIGHNKDVDRNYSKYNGLPRDTYVNICWKGEKGPRIARTQNGQELYFGDEVEFEPEERGRYERRGHLVWEGAARNIRKRTGSFKPAAGKKAGLVYIGETFSKKKHGESVFVPVRVVPNLNQEQLKKAYQGLLETLEIYQNPAINRSKGHSGYIGFELAQRERGIPVWYSDKDAKFSMASIGRTFFRTTLNELVGERRPCTDRKKLCEACALFGMTGKESLGSRIRFTDARVEEGYRLKKVTLQILGQPRYSYMPFYTRTNGGAPTERGYDDKNVEIAGRKFYWHNARAAKEPGIYAAKERNKMNSTLELAMPGTEFTFDIYYDGVTQEQLEKLMWCLNFGENRKDGDLCHKMGRGKPLGLGSVKIVIEEKAERTFENGAYKWKREKPEEVGPEPELRNKEALRKVMDFRWLDKGPNKGVAIMYPDVYDEHGRPFPEPRTVNEEARHVWYMKNKELGRPANDPIELLPKILEADQTLHAYQKRKDNVQQKGLKGRGRR